MAGGTGAAQLADDFPPSLYNVPCGEAMGLALMSIRCLRIIRLLLVVLFLLPFFLGFFNLRVGDASNPLLNMSDMSSCQNPSFNWGDGYAPTRVSRGEAG